MFRKTVKVLALALIPLVCASGAFAAKGKGGAKGPTPEEMAAAWAKAATPGENHKILNAMAGKFTATVKYWMSPDQPPTESKATSENEMILGGRYLQQKYKGDFRGSPIEGVGIVGYDNTSQKYLAIWVDSASTDVLVTEGTGDAKSIKAKGSFTDSLTGKQGKLRTVTELVDADTVKYELYKTRRGKEAKVLEVEYKRAK